MIPIKTNEQLERMRVACRITALARKAAYDAVAPGVTTDDIDRIVRKTIEEAGAKPSFLGYGGFPASACVSINDEVIHGIPSKKRVVRSGDIVKIDVGAYIGGFHGDCACTVPCGEVSEEAKRLIEVTRQSFYEGIKFAREGCRVSDISAAVQAYAQANGFSVVRSFVGHGVGRQLHESPEVPNFGRPGHGVRLQRGMTLAVEPMVNAGVYDVRVLSDGWTVKTKDGKLSAHYENTIAITDGEPEILTAIDGEVL
ncbi:type I methionyl aminopeptidase [Butyricicoccus pullicaecorum]|uniref:Methionine aminopeptidase n=2 Tax=Butyricicoccus pullicaecorum TaxID=501571 RepID=R8VT49_9FIRM|nr:type I methionyl aminopeptidase [Butyricicoccus pullicaecorum]HJC20835.1 type I methionyl aminopeptidase [Candidatus Butyricicoccus avicola]EOQ35708.1 methionine aminopeptidase, type I [Butyricicoccus pullicaecorum 1.2]MBS5280051.1 type I methionyl aminopeptidase [Butyricicoccus pullicaecorum]MDY2970406.1 type I methionyl aminopeptidase [Butyricicoccus pullicaecorum]OUP53486.1 methionine aminopeptidase [Butyricicoccus pullicaecorum]